MRTANNRQIVVIGAGGHARVVIDVLRQANVSFLGIVDPKLGMGEVFAGLSVLGNDAFLDDLDPSGVLLANGIGSMPGVETRWKIQEDLGRKGFEFVNVIHPSAIISSDVDLAEGVQIMAGTILQPGVSIGRGSIVNTASSIDHDCVIGANCHIAPGVTLSGDIKIYDNSHIGTGASIIQGVTIGKNSVVAAGSVVFHSLDIGTKLVQRREQIVK